MLLGQPEPLHAAATTAAVPVVPLRYSSVRARAVKPKIPAIGLHTDKRIDTADLKAAEGVLKVCCLRVCQTLTIIPGTPESAQITQHIGIYIYTFFFVFSLFLLFFFFVLFPFFFPAISVSLFSFFSRSVSLTASCLVYYCSLCTRLVPLVRIQYVWPGVAWPKNVPTVAPVV